MNRMPVILHHNPRCSNSRDALRLLEERGIEPKIVLYLETPPTKKEVKGILAKLGIGPRELMRSKEALYKSLGLGDPKLSDAALIRAMAENPVLIERPIVISGRRAVIGRPPERVLEIV
jgi:arsenate reductase (glutaredoxin)